MTTAGFDCCVVVPAHDEEDLVSGTLESLHEAAAAAGIRPRIIVVADACTDATAAISARLGAEVVETAARSVGAARRAGFEHILDRASAPGTGTDPADDALWLATTDADSTVPLTWFSRHLAYRDSGADLVVGTVVLEPGPPVDPIHERWASEYALKIEAERHHHIHGANLGFTAGAYRALGGFRALPLHEDVDLVRRATASDLSVVWALDIPVTTSRRTHGRSPGGFSDDLKAMVP
mgnify:CR=1 FL=1